MHLVRTVVRRAQHLEGNVLGCQIVLTYHAREASSPELDRDGEVTLLREWWLMHTQTFFYIIGFIFILSWNYPVEAKSLPVVQVGIVRDGSSELVPELRDLIQKDILELTSREFDVRFPDDLQLEGGWTVQGVKQAIDRMLTQPRVDLVIALGILASHEVSQRRQLPKPVIAPFIIDPHLQGLPFKKGTSGMKNLSYLVTGKGFERNLEVFKEVFPFTRLSLLADRVLLEAFPLFKDRARKIGARGEFGQAGRGQVVAERAQHLQAARQRLHIVGTFFETFAGHAPLRVD